MTNSNRPKQSKCYGSEGLSIDLRLKGDKGSVLTELF